MENLIKKKSLYCYFGQLGINYSGDIPGHMFYQIPLIDSITEKFKVDKIDFYSYLNPSLQLDSYEFQDTKLGVLLENICNDKIDLYCPNIKTVLHNIRSNSYEFLFLKARFRNKSTLLKKWDDASQFEEIILNALDFGYDPSKIIIIDTDLSMPLHFKDWLKLNNITILIPSIDFNVFTYSFINNLKLIYDNKEKLDIRKNAFYYGNIFTHNYKKGHSKNPILLECISEINKLRHFGLYYKTYITISDKESLLYINDSTFKNKMYKINRCNRKTIQETLELSALSLNISKDLYSEIKFIPARVYEALMFGALPVSYNMPYISELLNFTNINQLKEISKYILELNSDEYFKLYDETLSNFMTR